MKAEHITDNSFLVGGSRIATMDNVRDTTLKNTGTVNLAGPLVVGFEIQTDVNQHNINGKGPQGKREVINDGTITDIIEEGYRGAEGLGGLNTPEEYENGTVKTPQNGIELALAPKLGGGKIDVKRAPDIVDGAGNVIKKGGHTGYKVGLILTYEDNDSYPTSDYRLINGEKGKINFNGRKSIGIQIYAPESPQSHITVQNNGTITMGGIQSYGLKLSSRVSEENFVFENNKIINITGEDKKEDSLSSGIAVIEDTALTGDKGIRAYKGKVKNKGTINVSGGKGNTGIVLKVKADDYIINEGTINVSGNENIGLRVDKGNVQTLPAAGESPFIVNVGSINLSGKNNAGIVANGGSIVQTGNYKAFGYNNGNTVLESGEGLSGMIAINEGGVENSGTIKGENNISNSLGISVLENSSGRNSGTVELKGKGVAGVYNNLGFFEMGKGTIDISGEQSIGVYSKDTDATSGKTRTLISDGKIKASQGAVALYADDSTVSLGKSAGNTLELIAGDKGLMFYNYASGNSNNPSGKFKLDGTVNGIVENGGTAFYFKGSLNNISSFLNNMFTVSPGVNRKVNLNLKDGATLFVLDSPTGTILLSQAGGSGLTGSLGGRVEISATSPNAKYKTYSVYKGNLEIDKNVNIDDESDDYHKVSFTSSNITVNNGVDIRGTKAFQVVAAQSNYPNAVSADSVKILNKGTINLSGEKSTALAGDFATVTNEGNISVTGKGSLGIFGSDGSIVKNDGVINLGSESVGIYGANVFKTGGYGNKNINIANTGTLKSLSGAKGVYGIYALNNKNTYSTATALINHSGNIDFSESGNSVGIKTSESELIISGNISVKDNSIGADSENGKVTVNGGNVTLGESSVAYKLTGGKSVFNGNNGTVNVKGKSSVVYLLENTDADTTVNFKDNLALNGTTGEYSYINLSNSNLKYNNQKAINNDSVIFINAKNSSVEFEKDANISSGNKGVIGVYSENPLKDKSVINKGIIRLNGENSTGIYLKEGKQAKNYGIIEVGKNGTGIYGIQSVNGAHNMGLIRLNGEGSVGIRSEHSGNTFVVSAGNKGLIESNAKGVIGISSKGSRSFILDHEGTIRLLGSKSVGIHLEGPHGFFSNSGHIIVGDSEGNTPSIGVYSDQGSRILNFQDIIAGNNSIGIYGSDVKMSYINPRVRGRVTVGNGGTGIYSYGGTVQITDNTEITVGENEAVGVYIAGNRGLLENSTDRINIGRGSYGFVISGKGNRVISNNGGLFVSKTVMLKDDSIYIYSTDNFGIIENNTDLKSTGNENYGIYSAGRVENYGNMDFSSGVGNVGIYSLIKENRTPAAAVNSGIIDVAKSDLSITGNEKYGIGMAAGYTKIDPVTGDKTTVGVGNIENYGIIKVTSADSIGMYATGQGSKAVNHNRIEIGGKKRNIGMYLENGAEGINEGIITTVGNSSENKGQIGIVVTSGATLENKGSINIDATDGIGIYIAGGIIKNYGEANISVSGDGAEKIKELEAKDTSKKVGDVSIKAGGNIPNAEIRYKGQIVVPKIVDTINKKPGEMALSSIGMHIDTSGINYTKPINGLSHLRNIKNADLIIGTEATKYNNEKYIQLSQEIIKPYNEMITSNPQIEKWSIYSAGLNWLATATQDTNYRIQNVYLVKIPYTTYAENKDTYNFLDGLEQRYDKNSINSREKELFNKLNDIGNNEKILLQQAFDEMMGHQYANTQRRIYGTGKILDRQLDSLMKEWKTASKQSNKITAFGTKDEYKTDTAGIKDYASNAYGAVYAHENETIKLGNSSGWYAGVVNNRFNFKDIGKSQENTVMVKLGVFKSTAFDHNGSLKWTISGEGFGSRSEMKRKYLVVNEIFNGQAEYYTYGAALKNEISKEYRLGEKISIRPYGSLKLEYGRFGTIKEKTGEVRLEVKGNDYYSVRPEAGVELKFKQPIAKKAVFTTSLELGYENELGKVGNIKNKARVGYTAADWYNLKSEKDDRKGNFKADLNLGLENQRAGVTLNAGYDTKGKNVRGGIGIRVIY